VVEEIDLTNKTILIAEDLEINREIAVALLEPTGANIITTENGKCATEKFKEGGIDLILMDLQMPEMDGFEATRVIREMEGNAGKRIPIIAMTANVFKEDISKCLAAGMNDHIGKPIRIDEMLQKIAKYLR
jgi:CheY-like chemotaxis protein